MNTSYPSLFPTHRPASNLRRAIAAYPTWMLPLRYWSTSWYFRMKNKKFFVLNISADVIIFFSGQGWICVMCNGILLLPSTLHSSRGAIHLDLCQVNFKNSQPRRIPSSLFLFIAHCLAQGWGERLMHIRLEFCFVLNISSRVIIFFRGQDLTYVMCNGILLLLYSSSSSQFKQGELFTLFTAEWTGTLCS